jgi:hypothetical protein
LWAGAGDFGSLILILFEAPRSSLHWKEPELGNHGWKCLMFGTDKKERWQGFVQLAMKIQMHNLKPSKCQSYPFCMIKVCLPGKRLVKLWLEEVAKECEKGDSYLSG